MTVLLSACPLGSDGLVSKGGTASATGGRALPMTSLPIEATADHLASWRKRRPPALVKWFIERCPARGGPTVFPAISRTLRRCDPRSASLASERWWGSRRGRRDRPRWAPEPLPRPAAPRRVTSPPRVWPTPVGAD